MALPADPASEHVQLPPELWMRIFFWATYSPARELDALLNVPLFDGINHRNLDMVTAEALRVKASLALVCRQWRSLSEQYLYEDLRIRHGKYMLADVLELSRRESQDGLGYGRYVSRIVLPQLQEKDTGHGHSRHWADEATSRIIKCCPNLLVLSRYHEVYTKKGYDSGSASQQDYSHLPKDDDVDCCSICDPPLPTIRRLDWCNGTMIGDPWHPTICAVPSALWSAQQLEVLSLSGENYFWGPTEVQHLSAAGRGAILLPNVHTLRIASLYAFGVPGISNYKLALPCLRRIILDRGEALHRLTECVFTSPLPTSITSCLSYKTIDGPCVSALEIGSPNWRFTRSDYVSTFIRHYPTASSLHYPIFFVRPLRWRRLRDNGLAYSAYESQRVFSSLRVVGLHAEPNPELLYSTEGDTADAMWAHIHAHARALLGSSTPTLMESRLPGVKEVILYGNEWAPLVRDRRFHLVLDLANARGAEIKADDAAVAVALVEAESCYKSRSR